MKKRVLVTIDIGNTAMSLGLLKGQKVIKSFSIETRGGARFIKRELSVRVSYLRKRYLPRDALICSVVPDVVPIVLGVIKRELRVAPKIVGKDILVPIINRYKKPEQVGQDRLVCAYAAKMMYGAPAIVIDLGTAMTFDAVSQKGEYLGGIIVPGIRLTAESLVEKTALLPKVRIKRPKQLIGQDTKNSILSGIFYGYGSLCDGLIGMLVKEIKGRPIVVATGGYVREMKQYAKKIQVTDKHLIFKGLSMLYWDDRQVL